MQGEFQVEILDLQVEFCQISVPEGGLGPAITLPSEAMKGQEEWLVVSRSAKRMKVLKACGDRKPLHCVEGSGRGGGGHGRKRRGKGGGRCSYPAPKIEYLLGIVRLDI